MYNNEEIIEICKKSNSMSEAARTANIPYNRFRRIAKSLGVFNPNQNWNKNKSFLSDERLKSKYTIETIFCENSKYPRDRIKKVIISLNLKKYECDICAINKWEEKPLSLHIDHINGVRNDNRIENLRFLCPNCHSQTETYCSKNKTMKFEQYEIEYIKSIIEKSKSINECLSQLGLLNNKTNKIKLQRFIDEYNLSFNILKLEYNIIEQKLKKEDIKVYQCNECKCKIEKRNKTNLCNKCYKQKRKATRPPYKELIEQVKNDGYCAVGRKYGVSDNAVRKWLKSYESEMPS